jgi:protein required for attachment to host cells
MNGVWIVVASSTKCRIFTQDKHQGPLTKIDEIGNPEGRLHAGDINTDRPGRSFDSHNRHRHALGQHVDPVELESIRFAKTVATHLDRARQRDRFQRLALVADPRFLGHLRQELSHATRSRLSAELDKNLSEADPAAIREALPYRI